MSRGLAEARRLHDVAPATREHRMTPLALYAALTEAAGVARREYEAACTLAGEAHEDLLATALDCGHSLGLSDPGRTHGQHPTDPDPAAARRRYAAADAEALEAQRTLQALERRQGRQETHMMALYEGATALCALSYR